MAMRAGEGWYLFSVWDQGDADISNACMDWKFPARFTFDLLASMTSEQEKQKSIHRSCQWEAFR